MQRDTAGTRAIIGAAAAAAGTPPALEWHLL